MHPEPLLYILGMPIYAFGLFAAFSIFLGYWMTEQQMNQSNLPAEFLPDFSLAIMFSAFAGARILFVLLHLDDYLKHPLDSFKIWQGGLVLYGGIAGGLGGGYAFCSRKKISFPACSDAVAVGLALGLAVSRLGCFFAGCCYGKPTSFITGVRFTHLLSLAQPHDLPLHPVQLYAFSIELLIFFFLLTRKKKFDGEMILTYLFLASGSRLFLEFFRAETNAVNHAAVVLFFIMSGFLLWYFNQVNLKGGVMKLKSYFQLTAISLFAVFFAACGIISTQKMTRGTEINQSEVNQLVKGTSTEKDTLKLFGPPTKVRDTADGGKEYLWEYAKSGGFKWNLLFSVGGSTESRTLLVWLDKEGMVTDYAFKKS